jgi:hypothetical protein
MAIQAALRRLSTMLFEARNSFASNAFRFSIDSRRKSWPSSSNRSNAQCTALASAPSAGLAQSPPARCCRSQVAMLQNLRMVQF